MHPTEDCIPEPSTSYLLWVDEHLPAIYAKAEVAYVQGVKLPKPYKGQQKCAYGTDDMA